MPELQEEDREPKICSDVTGNILHGMSRVPDAKAAEEIAEEWVKPSKTPSAAPQQHYALAQVAAISTAKCSQSERILS